MKTDKQVSGIINQNQILSKAKKKEQLVALLFLLPAIVLYILFKYIPILMGLFVSFFEVNIIDLPGRFIGLQSYIKAFHDKIFYEAILHNIMFLAVGFVMNFWPPILLAFLINEIRGAKTFFRTVYFIPAVAPMIAVTVLWKYIWQPDYGLANYLLSTLGLQVQFWLNDTRLVYWCMALPGLIIAGGMNMLIYLASMQNVPEELYEAALVDGAGLFARFRCITLPFIMPIIKTMLILEIINRFNEVNTPLVMTGGGPVGFTQTLILYAYKLAMDKQNYGYAITIANIIFVIIFIITAIQMKLQKDED